MSNLKMAKIVKALNTTNNTIVPDSDVIVSNALKSSDLGGSTTYYTNVSDLPISAPAFTKALVTSTNTLYQYNGGWYPIALINNFSPSFITEPNATYTLNSDGSATTVTVLAQDSDDVPIAYTVVTDSNFDAFATITHDSEKHNVWTITPTVSSGEFSAGTVTFRASDGVNLANVNSEFSISFGPDWSVAPTESILRASDGEEFDRLGESVSISGDGTYAIAGAYGENADINNGGQASGWGAAYVYTKSGSTWTQQARLVASDRAAGDQFGRAIDISSDGTYAIIGAPQSGNGSAALPYAGAAYIFTRSGSTWTQQAKIVSSDLQTNDHFGDSVSISSDGNYAVVGTTWEKGGAGDPLNFAGAAYIFSRSGSTWTQQAKIVSSDLEAGDQIGLSVSINGDGSYVIVGAHGEDTGGSLAGAAYIFTRSGSTWTQQQKIQASDATNFYQFGRAVDINSDGTYAIVGSTYEVTWPGPGESGAAYIFTRSGSTWTEQAKIKASDAASFDWFGEQVSINSDGSYAVVCAQEKDLVTGSSYPNKNHGAVYIFSRSGSTWTQERKITASDIQPYDLFGYSLSMSSNGAKVIVGAPEEDTDGTNAGAVYIYEAS